MPFGAGQIRHLNVSGVNSRVQRYLSLKILKTDTLYRHRTAMLVNPLSNIAAVFHCWSKSRYLLVSNQEICPFLARNTEETPWRAISTAPYYGHLATDVNL